MDKRSFFLWTPCIICVCVFYSLHKTLVFSGLRKHHAAGEQFNAWPAHICEVKNVTGWSSCSHKFPVNFGKVWVCDLGPSSKISFFKMHPSHEVWQKFGCSWHLSRWYEPVFLSIHVILPVPPCVKSIENLKNKIWIENIWQRVQWNRKCPNIVIVAGTSLHISPSPIKTMTFNENIPSLCPHTKHQTCW